jgi:hypothetical protein
MFWENTPIIIPLALVTALVLFLVAAFWSMPGVTRRVLRSVWCPVRDRYFAAEIEEEVWDGKRVGVSSCEAFSPPSVVTCEKRCLQVTKRPAAWRDAA